MVIDIIDFRTKYVVEWLRQNGGSVVIVYKSDAKQGGTIRPNSMTICTDSYAVIEAIYPGSQFAIDVVTQSTEAKTATYVVSLNGNLITMDTPVEDDAQ